MLVLAGATGAKEEAIKQDVPRQGVELLFPVGTGKSVKGAKLSKEEKNAAALLKKLKAIEKGGNVNAVDKLGQTALMHAATQDNKLAICWLVAKGADASIKSKSGKTVASVAHGDMREFLTALEKEKQPLSRQEARDMYTYRGITPGEDISFYSKVDAILQLRGAKAEDLSKLKNKEWEVSRGMREPMELALLYRIGARKFSFDDLFPGGLSDVNEEPLQLLRALGVKTDIVGPVLQMKIALQLKQKETALVLLKQNPALLQNPDIFSSISDEKTLQALLDAGLDTKNEKLMEAVIKKGDGAMLRTLLKAGATLQNPDEILKRSSHKGADFILALIGAGANANALNTLPVEMIAEAAPWDTELLAHKNSATLLHNAANEVNLRDVQLLLAHRANPNIPGKKVKDDQEAPYGMTPLMAAANSARGEENAAHRTEIVKRLLDAGADVHAKDSAGNGVIYYAACGGMKADLYDSDYTHRVSGEVEADILSMVKLLLKARADVPRDILTQELRPEISPAGREKLTLMLLDAGADPLAKSESGKTTLMINGIWGGKIAKRLLDAGVNPTVCVEGENSKDSAMSLAMKEGAVEVVKLLKEKGIDSGELQLMDQLGDKPLLPEKIEPLLKLGARIRIPKDMTNRLLGNMTGGHASRALLLYEDYVDIIQILKKHGFKPELMAWAKKDHSDWLSFNTEALRAFFKTGSNPNEVDESGNSLLANIVSSARVSDEYDKHRIAGVLHAFIEAGVDLNLKNKDGKSILQLAKEKKLRADIIQLLKEHGAKE